MVGIKYPMAGVEGGKDGAPNQLDVRFDTQPKRIGNIANAEPHAAGEAFEYLYGGGGGYGDPLLRDPASVRDDVLDEYVSPESAARDYGVVLVGERYESELRVDEEETRALRAKLRSERERARA
jgi:N-methylhydantoinase B